MCYILVLPGRVRARIHTNLIALLSTKMAKMGLVILTEPGSCREPTFGRSLPVL